MTSIGKRRYDADVLFPARHAPGCWKRCTGKADGSAGSDGPGNARLVGTGHIGNRAGTMDEEDRGDGYTYWLRYLDEDAWELVGVDTVWQGLTDVYRDVSLALYFLHEAGRIRTPAAMYGAARV